ncbi:MAG: hypothetical protein Q9168_004112, partial [Polycauliona sp. 1 TL-2023]
MPRLSTSEHAFLSLVKSLHKGKGKENVPTDVLSHARPFVKTNGDFTPAPPGSDFVEEAPGQTRPPTVIDAPQEPLTETSPMEALAKKEATTRESAPSEQSPATYTVIGSNFAPETTAADIEAVISDLVGPIQDCRIVSENPFVIAEMVFTEVARAQHVIDSLDNKKADGYLLRLCMKPDPAGASPTAFPHRLESAQFKEDVITVGGQSEQRPQSPILRGRGRTRYHLVDGPAETLNVNEAPESIANGGTHQVEKIVQQLKLRDMTRVYMDCEEQEHASPPTDPEDHAAPPIEGEGGTQSQEADAEAPNQLANGAEAGVRNRKEFFAKKLQNLRNHGPETEISRVSRESQEDEELAQAMRMSEEDYQLARALQISEESYQKEIEAVNPSDDIEERAVENKSADTAPSATTTAKDTAPVISAAMDGTTDSHQPSPVPTITAEATPQPAKPPKSTKPLLSSGQAFLEALNQRPTPPKYTSTNTSSSPATALPDDILPDELPTATKTEPNLSNSHAQEASSVAQIETTGTLQTPTGEHTIHLAPKPSTTSNTTAIQNTSTKRKFNNDWD